MTPDDIKDLDLPNSFLDSTLQLCIVTHDLDKAVKVYADKLGIGPWWIYDLTPPDLTDTKICGVPTPFSMRIALAWVGAMNWEIIQPLEGPTVYERFLKTHGEGVQHIALSYSGLDFDLAKDQFMQRGFAPVQELVWKGVKVCYFNTEPKAHTTFEIWCWPEGMELPEPQRWYPAKPSG